MWKKLKAWRREHFPTAKEQFDDGVAYVDRELDRQHPVIGMAVLNMLPLSTGPLDRGIWHAKRLYQHQYDTGYFEAKKIIADKPAILALPLLNAKIEQGGHYGRGVLHAVENKERNF